MGTYYTNGAGDRTMDIARDPTPLFGFMAFDRPAPVPPAVSARRNLSTALAIAGAVFVVLLLCGIGGWLFSAAFCPCSFGSDPAPVDARNQVTVTSTAPYEPASCAAVAR